MWLGVVVWIAVGMGGAFLAAAVISVALGGPAWPYYLGLGMGSIVAAFAIGLRHPPRTGE